MIIFFLFSLVGWSKEIEVNSLKIRELLETNNSKVAAARLESEAAEDLTGSLGRSFIPSLGIYAGQESFKSGEQALKTEPSYGAELRWNLFNGFRDQLDSEVRFLESEKKKNQSLRVSSEEAEKARSTYWNLLFIRDKLALLKSSTDINRVNLDSAQKRIRGGVATQSDRFEFEMKDVELRREISVLELEFRTTSNLLKVVLGLQASDQLIFKEQLSHDHDFEVLFKHTSQDHEFFYKEQEIQSMQSQLRGQALGRSWWPKVDAFAAYNQYNERDKEFGRSQDRTESVVGLRATLLLSAGFEDLRQAESSRKLGLASQRMAEAQKQEIEIHLQGEMEELKLLHNQVHEAEENIERANRYYKLTLSEYGRGVKNSPDVLGASEKLFGMQHKRLEIIRAFQLSKAHVLAKIGK